MRLSNEIKKQAEEWDINNMEMPSIEIPKGYMAKYIYECPVIYRGTGSPNLPVNVSYKVEDGLGIITITTYSEISDKEINDYQKMLKNTNIECLSHIRLTKQSFSLDKSGR